jgi:hypothetical protein
MLMIPRRHVASFFEVTNAECADLMSVLAACVSSDREPAIGYGRMARAQGIPRCDGRMAESRHFRVSAETSCGVGRGRVDDEIAAGDRTEPYFVVALAAPHTVATRLAESLLQTGREIAHGPPWLSPG